jgi:hypothetical protein
MTIAIAANTPDTEKPTLLIDNVFTQGTVTGSGGGVPENAIGDNTFDFWTATSATATISVDLGLAQYCDGVGIAAHTLGTVGATVQVQSSDNGTDWVTRLTTSPMTDTTILGVFPVVLARYWQLRVTNGPASIGVIKLGRRIIVPSGVSLGHVSANHAERIELLSNDSVDGQFLNTRVIRRSGETNLDFGLVPASFVDNEMGVFEMLYNEGRTFFYAGSPLNLPRDVAYCKRPMGGSEMRPIYEGGELMQLDFEAQIYVG